MSRAMNKRKEEVMGQVMKASLKGDGRKVKELVEACAKQQDISPIQVLTECKDSEGKTALHFACYSTPDESVTEQDEDIVPFLLHWLSSLPKKDDTDDSSLTTITTLLQTKDKEGITPLMLAARNPNEMLAQQRVDTILSVGSDKLALARSKAGATALHYAAAADHTTPATILRLYQAARVALETNSNKGGTPLHWAAAVSPPTDHSRVLNTLIQQCGANINALNEQGLPPLIMAAGARNDVHAALLVRNGADISIVLPGTISIFHMAADLNLIKTLTALVETHDKATIQVYCNQKTDTGETPLDVALQEGNLQCVMLLSDEQDEAAAQAMIDEAKKNKKESSDTSNVATTTTEEQQVTELVAQIAGMNISDDNIEKALKLKQQGNEHFSKREWHDSMECYTKAIQLNPTDATFYSNRSACYMELQQPQEALRDALIARHLRPDWTKACYRMTVARMALGRYEDAAVAAFEGLQHDEDNVELRQLLRKAVDEGKKEHQRTLKAEGGKAANEKQGGDTS